MVITKNNNNLSYYNKKRLTYKNTDGILRLRKILELFGTNGLQQYTNYIYLAQ